MTSVAGDREGGKTGVNRVRHEDVAMKRNARKGEGGGGGGKENEGWRGKGREGRPAAAVTSSFNE